MRLIFIGFHDQRKYVNAKILYAKSSRENSPNYAICMCVCVCVCVCVECMLCMHSSSVQVLCDGLR